MPFFRPIALIGFENKNKKTEKHRYRVGGKTACHFPVSVKMASGRWCDSAIINKSLDLGWRDLPLSYRGTRCLLSSPSTNSRYDGHRCLSECSIIPVVTVQRQVLTRLPFPSILLAFPSPPAALRKRKWELVFNAQSTTAVHLAGALLCVCVCLMCACLCVCV